MDEQSKRLSHLIHRCGHTLGHYHGNMNMTQIRVLRLLEEKGTLPQKELAELFHVKASSVSEIIAKLEGYGYVERKKDEHDKRVMLVSLTKVGKCYLDLESQKHDEFLQFVFEKLPDQDKNELECLLNILLDRANLYYEKKSEDE